MGNKQTEKKKRQRKNRQQRKQQIETKQYPKSSRYHLRHVRRRLRTRYELYLVESEVREIETNIRGGFCTFLDNNPETKTWRVITPWSGEAILGVWNSDKNCLVTVLNWNKFD